ncbi:ABC transporter substrate-binding protein [Demequina sp. TTPB684]|uniref:ABC transporter substrate-binding protein n=1 Tax=unclassified Demequina TaxID=2620311 RepID=UPI001CF13D14|nr:MULTISPECIES: ABC transporter substrate-binding protein [unclassified Demequina]MCB2412242.1 ABC transporter substrate-binding protein [Demequina sp. TTPB684]UPU87776.1 ABC transporter substrate-binding protein [Demequina sp. TMPB413]
MRNPTFARRAGVALMAAAALTLAACSSSGSPEASNTANPTDSAPPAADAFPVTLEHKYGETTIESQPERVVTVGYHEQDWLYALGVAPVAVREWFGGYDYATWPWADEAREAVGAEPEVLANAELNIEQVAGFAPDLIIATWSGITQEEYDLLSQIAPVVAQSGDYADYGMPFDEETRLIAAAVGKSEQGEELIEANEELFASTREAHPDWEGKTGAVGFLFEGQPGAYYSHDPRPALLQRLGLETTVVDQYGDVDTDFYLTVSPERLDILDLDTVIWLAALSPDTQAQIEAMPGYDSLGITMNGGHIWSTSNVFEGAFSFASPLSQAYVVEQLAPKLDAALDGDPATEVPAFEEAA